MNERRFTQAAPPRPWWPLTRECTRERPDLACPQFHVEKNLLFGARRFYVAKVEVRRRF